MTTQKPESGDSRRDEVIAGEYVLGVLSAEDRRKVEARMATDSDFAAMVLRWRNNLATFDTAYETIAQARALPAAEHRAFEVQAGAGDSIGLWNSLSFWRSLAIASLAAVAVLMISLAGLFGGGSGSRPLVIELSGEGNAIGFVATFDIGSGRLRLTPVAAGGDGEKSLEFWLLSGDDPAISLGVLPQSGEGEFRVPPAMRTKVAEGSTLAVSLEPRGGSPSGLPSGPFLARGTAGYR
ncbi:anti-sigma factor domain-containing protein [Sinorhizobium americanum]|uniref:Anti-sigma-K factor RskA n=1 Tax=Sinorhizobium americanum TaxID=194963 RepID=A0A4R2C8Q6_9HYPH|nr:anti-sigma factor [Sinorhizobium americanum]TCN36255.1 anti-sigma-K factor RskA [Sinorhizobium americanum]